MPQNKEEITPEVFNHLVDLAALALNQQESEYLRRELNHQLSAIHALEAISLDENIPPALHGVPYPAAQRQSLRSDDWRPSDKAADITAQVPQLEEGYIVVPDIPHTDLE